MKKLLVLCLFISFANLLQAQILKPAKWHFDISKKEVKTGDEIDLIFYADIEPDWYLYSTDFDADLGPTVTTFTFAKNESFELKGKIKTIGSKKKFDHTWNGEITYFTTKAEFRQTIKILKTNPIIKGTFEYQVCTNKDGKCVPGDGEFDFNQLKVLGGGEEKKNEIKPIEPEKDKNKVIEKTKIRSEKKNESLWGFMFIAFLGGLSALITPCVFPMIPMTVTFFTKQSSNRRQGIFKAIIFGLSIILIYTIPGTLVAIFGGGDAANFLSTHWLPNILFFVIFVVFALSFLGLFEIVLPSSLVNKVDAASDRGGYLGIFFMAFTLALVSFSCTGPIVGSLLVEASRGHLLKPILGMFSFSLAIALPYTLFAIFPSWMKSLPKSGSWLNSVKVVLGFLELALSLKFLSIVDQVYHWGILDRDVFLSLWIVIFAMIGFYFLGKIILPHDTKEEKISVPKMILAILTFAFVVYLIPGLFGAPLHPLAGYLPPETTIEDRNLYSVNNNGNSKSENLTSIEEPVKYSNLFKFPYQLQGFFDYEQALAYSKKVNKPIFIDFTGHGCVNCREMESRVWGDKEVLKRLQNDYVLLGLYVDDKTDLPEQEWIKGNDGKTKKTIGAKNSSFQIDRYNNNAQPFYVLLNTNGERLLEPIAYDLTVQSFVDFLDLGLKNFKEQKTEE